MLQRFLVLLPLAASAAAQTCPSTPIYSTCDLSFEITEQEAAQHPNPYLTVNLHGEFRSPRHRTHTILGYWDGGRRYIVRYSPTDPGNFDFRVTSNIASLNGKMGNFTATASENPGFLQPDNVHAFSYTETRTAHLWMGDTILDFATMDAAAFERLAAARSKQNFNHVRGLVIPNEVSKAFLNPETPNHPYFQELDRRVKLLNSRGIFADLILAPTPEHLLKLLPQFQHRERLSRYLVARYGAAMITWQGVAAFEDSIDGRKLLNDLNTLIQRFDAFHHPRSTGSAATSAPLLSDGWMNFVTYGSDAVPTGAIERQILRAPLVQTAVTGEPEAFVKRLWNTSMSGQYQTVILGESEVEGPRAKAMTAWYDFFSDTRFWELDPFFEIDNGRGLSLDGIEYIVFLETPGPVELVTERKTYQVYWFNPFTGDYIQDKKNFKGEKFSGSPPDTSHPWVLHLSRDGRKHSMAKSWKFESRRVVKQVVEGSPPKIPYLVELPVSDEIPAAKPIPFRVKLTKETRASKAMQYLWTAEATADGQGYRVLATTAEGEFTIPVSIARSFPAVVNLRVQGINGNGKVYSLDRVIKVTR